MNMADPSVVAKASFKVINQLQNFDPGIQATTAAAVFLVLCEHFKVPAQDIFTATKNLLNDQGEKQQELRALHDYVKSEIKV